MALIESITNSLITNWLYLHWGKKTSNNILNLTISLTRDLVDCFSSLSFVNYSSTCTMVMSNINNGNMYLSVHSSIQYTVVYTVVFQVDIYTWTYIYIFRSHFIGNLCHCPLKTSRSTPVVRQFWVYYLF